MSRKSKVGNLRQKKNGTWLASVECGTRADGSRRTVSKVFKTKDEASEWLLSKAIELGRRPDLDAGVTLSAIWKLYESDKGERLAKKTLSAYRSQMRTWLAVMGDTDISHITCAQVQHEIRSMTHENALHSKRALSSVLTYAVSIGALASNPLHGYTFEIPEKKNSDADYDDDPFAVIEESRNVWDINVVMRCYVMIQGLPLEPAWLACVGGGLRVEEAMALRKMDVRRVLVAGVEVTQLAVHHASTSFEKRKETKTRGSVRIVTMLEPFGERLWEIVEAIEDRASQVCPLTAGRQNKAWRSYWEEPPTSKHAPKSTTHRGSLRELPYIPMAKMRNTHATLMAEAGVLDSINAALHGHSEQIAAKHYLRPDTAAAVVEATKKLRLVV